LFWLDGEDFSSELLLSCEIVLNWILAIVFDRDGVLFWFSNSDSSEIKDLSIFSVCTDNVDSTNCDGWSDLECFSVDLNNLSFLLNCVSLSIFNFKSNLLFKFIFFFSLEGNLNNLLLAWFKNVTSVRNSELCRKIFNSSKLPLSWNRTYVFKCKCLSQFLCE
jgi:hypothetical protein